MVRVSALYPRARVYPRVGVYEYDSLDMIESPKSIAISIKPIFIWEPELITGRYIWSVHNWVGLTVYSQIPVSPTQLLT